MFLVVCVGGVVSRGSVRIVIGIPLIGVRTGRQRFAPGAGGSELLVWLDLCPECQARDDERKKARADRIEAAAREALNATEVVGLHTNQGRIGRSLRALKEALDD